MTLADTRNILRSNLRNVLVEAPAGCGKTFEAADLAVELGAQLSDGAQVLVLAHTNAAVQEFMRRIRNTGARVRPTTIDAFCLDLLTPYAVPLDLPTPLRRSVGLGSDRIPFDALAPKVMELLSRCPSIATMLAYRYPFIILDEHQDASLPQHGVVQAFGQIAACRVRVFGDPMQAIYEADTARTVAWDHLSSQAEAVVKLDDPQRWRATPDLGDWILYARDELQAGRVLPLREAPNSVEVRRISELTCAGFGYGNAGQLSNPVQNFIDGSGESAAILSRHNNHVWGLHVASGDRLRLNEGSEFGAAYELLEAARANEGQPSRMALCLVDHIQTVSTGLDEAKRRAITSALEEDHIEYGRLRIVRDFLAQFEPLYRTPDLHTFCEVTRSIVASRPNWLTIRMPSSLRLIGQVRPRAEDNCAECLDEVVARIKSGARRLKRCVSTIHKAKGLEYDNVLIANFSAAHFGNDEMSRRLAYVALSRARQSITILVPGNSPSPLLG